MSRFTTKSTPTIEGPIIIRPTTLGLSREWLLEVEEQKPYSEMGLEEKFTHHTSETLARGVMRGLYFQRKDSCGTLLTVTSGSAMGMVVDLRPESDSFGAANSVTLSAENETMLYIPPYFAFGFLTLEASTTVVYNSGESYNPEERSGIIYDDEILAIEWQFERYDIDERRLSLSPQDRKFPSFRSYNQNTLWINRPKKSRYALSARRVIKKV